MNYTIPEDVILSLIELQERGSYKLLAHSIREETLSDEQTKALTHALLMKHALLNMDTGLGKTYVAAAIINCVALLDASVQWLYLCEASNLITTYNKLRSLLFNPNIVYSDATSVNVSTNFKTLKAQHASVLVVSYNAIILPEIEDYLYLCRSRFRGIILDESQMIANLSSHTSRLISAIVNSAEYRYAMSATPLRVNPAQVVNQIYMLDREAFADKSLKSLLNDYCTWKDGRIVAYHDLDQLAAQLTPYMISITRAELGIKGNYVPRVHIVPTNLRKCKSPVAVHNYKALSSSATADMLLQIISEHVSLGRTGIIYVNLNVYKEMIQSLLTEAGIRCAILDGTHTPGQRKEKIHRQFLNDEFNVLITNIATGKDLPCDYICFYELTFDYKQVIGRGERGLEGKDLIIDFVLTDSQYEINFFYNNVYQRGVMLEELCHKDLSELHAAIAQISDLLKGN